MVSDVYVLLGSAFVFSIFSIVVQYTIGDRARVKEIQNEMNSIQKEVQAAAKEKDEAKLKRLEERQKQMMDMMMESMKLQFKPMLLILPAFMLLFGAFGFNGFLNILFPDFRITLPVALHLNGAELLGLNVLRDSVYGVRGFFIVSLFCFGMILQLLVVPIVEKLLKK